MRNAVSRMALMLALAATSGAHAASFEYNNPSPFDPSKPAQPNLAQIGVTPALHATIGASSAPTWTTPFSRAIISTWQVPHRVGVSMRVSGTTSATRSAKSTRAPAGG